MSAGELNFQFQGPDGSVVIVLGGIFGQPTRLGAILTAISPPKNIVDPSPVFWVGSESGELPAGAFVSVVATNRSFSSVDPAGVTLPMYYSEDGVEFTQLETFHLSLLGPTALIDKPGFVVAGVGPGQIVCQQPDQ